MPNENPPVNAFKKGHKKLGGRPPGRRNVLTNDLKEALLEAATRVGFVREVDILDANGKPTGKKKPEWDGDGGLAGYLEWAAVFQPGHFIPQLGKVMPIQINAVSKIETKPVVRYETLEERRAAMIAKGWAPATVAALEEAMEPKFLRDMREENDKAMIAAAPDMLKALRTIEFDVRGRCTACSGWDGSSENDHKHANDCIVASAIAKATGT
jgi:hypothetical protein